jgi:hypothetical protein
MLDAQTGRPSMAPEKGLPALRRPGLSTIRREPLRMAQRDDHLLLRWWGG